MSDELKPRATQAAVPFGKTYYMIEKFGEGWLKDRLPGHLTFTKHVEESLCFCDKRSAEVIMQDWGIWQNGIAITEHINLCEPPDKGAPAAPAAQHDADPNAPWLTLAHTICADAGIAPGHITDRLNQLRERIAPAVPKPAVWRCFHCNEVFNDAEQAALHFGTKQQHEPMCQISPKHVRELEVALERYCEEDTDLHRQIHRMQADHHTALRREEEKGYARGLADAAQPAPVPAIPAGFRLMPIEPNEDMEIAGMEESVLGRPSIDDPAYVLSIYKAMTDAAPQSTAPQVQLSKPHPWAAFLAARADVIDWMWADRSCADIAINLSMDQMQVALIHMRDRSLDPVPTSSMVPQDAKDAGKGEAK